MSTYNFANLSPYDFELLVRDLLTRSESLNLRAFAPGRDSGIDLRAWESGSSKKPIIVQCKHMAGSSWSSLRSSVKGEKAKLDKLDNKPVRYILATTQTLTPGNVDELARILSPYCKSDEDILDLIAIERLLDEHAEVLRKHYKLWITSSSVLDRILNAKIYNRTDAYRSALLAKSRIFVQPKSFTQAQKILHNYHTCIISGPPGVGKTTLADMLCLDYLATDFELIVVSEDVSEADQIYSAAKKQIFIYDDFLGRTDLNSRLGKNEDSRLIEFIRRVEDNPNHRFILTTREYILRAARQRYERLDVEDLDVRKFMLRMMHYSQFEKGLILYQHLAFADDIDYADIEELVRSRMYRSIINHPNYTPRHITDALNDIQRRRKAGKHRGTR